MKLPGEETIEKGLADFHAGRHTIESLLVQIGASRLRRGGLRINGAINPDADYKLYALLAQTHGNEAHSQYNAWLRQLISFERALERSLSAKETGSRIPAVNGSTVLTNCIDKVPLECFPSLGIYQANESGHTVVIAAVLHAARDDRIWERRFA